MSLKMVQVQCEEDDTNQNCNAKAEKWVPLAGPAKVATETTCYMPSVWGKGFTGGGTKERKVMLEWGHKRGGQTEQARERIVTAEHV